MNITNIIAQLSELQLEQNKILAQIARTRTGATKMESEDTIHIGDHVLLLTGGIRCIKGDKAQVTEVTESAAVHFTVEYSRNVQKIA